MTHAPETGAINRLYFPAMVSVSGACVMHGYIEMKLKIK